MQHRPDPWPRSTQSRAGSIGREAADAVYRFLHPPADMPAAPEVTEVDTEETEAGSPETQPDNGGENEHLAFAEGD